MKISFLIKLIVCSLIFCSCKEKKPTEPEEKNEIRTDSTLIVDKYELPAGQTEAFPAAYEIIAEKDIDINGSLVIAGDKPGDFIIRSRNGNIRISGTVMVQKDTVQLTKHKQFISENFKLGKKSVVQGTNLSFIVDRPGGKIVFDAHAQVRSGDGTSPLDEIIRSGVEHYVGSVGAPGGDIIIRAIGGLIHIENINQFTKPLFILGNGGNGANVVIDRNTFQTSATKLDITGGRGGDSGILLLEAETIEGIPTVTQISSGFDMLTGGIGGDGGSAFWFNSNRPVFGNTEKINTTYALQEINFRGGDGGNGAVMGGNGGFAAYWGFRVINERDDPIASVKVTGGNGGDVFGSPIPVYFAIGGDGGEYFAWGNSGWNGVPQDSGGPINGADAGDVSGYGGNGGDVHEDVMYYSAIGGDGGNSIVARNEIIQKLSYFGFTLSGGFENQGLLFIVSGFGGKGADSECNGCPGGNGGNSGNVLAVGGVGGNVPNRPGNRGGRGGDVWDVVSWFPDSSNPIIEENQKGGDGNPPGKGGCSLAVATSPGSGGNGNLPGEDGQFLNVSTLGDDEHCDGDGNQCGEDLECDTDTTTMTSCTAIGATTTFYRKTPLLFDTDGNPIAFSEGNLTLTVLERNSFNTAPNVFFIDLNVRIPYSDTTITITYSGRSDSPEYTSEIHGYVHSLEVFVGQAHCSKDGELQWPGEGLHQTKCQGLNNPNVVCDEWELTGCIDFLKENDEQGRENATCCEVSPQNFVICPK